MSTKRPIKVFNDIKLDSSTLLDGFTPMKLEDIQTHFRKISSIKDEYKNEVLEYETDMQKHNDLNDVVEKINEANDQLDDLFKDFNDRMEYFTIVFFGAVSAGKTSMLCDLSNSTPQQITDHIKHRPGFDPEFDSFSIGPTVDTMNVYELLLKSGKLRLVDAPGIGGVVHESEKLLPYIKLADCIVFLFNASADISDKDYEFLENYVANNLIQADSKNELVEEGYEKNILIVFNKWSMISGNGRVPMEEQNRTFEKKRDWILNGKPGSGFKGLKNIFNSLEFVKANTSQRSPETGEPYYKAEVDEVVNGLKNIFDEQGFIIRLNKPKDILLKHFNKVEGELSQLRLGRQMEETIREFKFYQEKMTDLVDKLEKANVENEEEENQEGHAIFSPDNSSSPVVDYIENEMPKRLKNLKEKISSQIYLSLSLSLIQWKPDVGWGKRFKWLVPKWAADYFGWDSAGKANVQRDLKRVWESEFKAIFENNFDVKTIKEASASDCKFLIQDVGALMKNEFQKSSQQVKKVIDDGDAKHNTNNMNPEDEDLLYQRAISVTDTIEQAVSQVQDQVGNAIFQIFAIDGVLYAMLSVVLTPFGSVLFIALRNWWARKNEKENIKESMDRELKKTSDKIATSISNEIEKIVREGVSKIAIKYQKTLHGETDKISQPLQLIDNAIECIEKYKGKLQQLNFDY